MFAEARRRNVPVLLSVGYAACHWCHVMAHESFEDADVAALMNAHFVCIKLDREERPDLDDIYMQALHMMGEQGGWPLTMALDGDGKPFWGGTYFPKNPQYGRPGFMQILTELSRVWHETPDKIVKNTAALTQSLTAKAQADARGAMPADLPSRAATSLAGHIDREKGGLAGAPKFPQPFLYQFLWQQAQLTGDHSIQEAVITTATKICQGGIYDHIGGGFARYAVDEDWLVPHFEKMLYDNALLLQLLCLLWRTTRHKLFATRIAETIDWLLGDMQTQEGAFAASLDADTEGEEGKYYVWSQTEIGKLLGDSATAFCAAYDITADGNFEGQNIPNLLAQHDELMPELAEARARLNTTRSSRTPPGCDDKILADWNGMAIAALTEAAQLFARADWLAAAQKAYHAAQQALTDATGQLCHSARNDQKLALTLAGDLAFFGQGACALYQATGQAGYLADAEAYAAMLHNDFLDTARGGYLTNRRQADDTLLVNQRAVQDNAMPSANAATISLLAILAPLTGRPHYHAQAEAAFTALSGHLASAYPSMTALLAAHQNHTYQLSIILIGNGGKADILKQAALSHPVFARTFLHLKTSDDLPPDHPAAGKTMMNDQPTLYLCPGQSCLPPITEASQVTAQLDALLHQRQTA